MASIPPTAFPQPPPLRRHDNEGEEKEEGNKSILVNFNSVTTNIDSLPEELLFGILARLPAEFLHEKARFVCPKWNKIIHTQPFIDEHLRRHSTYGLLLTFVQGARQLGSHPHPLYVTATEGRIETNELSYECRTDIAVSSSKGLAVDLLPSSDGSSIMHIVNLATKQPFRLPLFLDKEKIPMHNLYGIACSPASMEHKVTLPFIVSRDGSRELRPERIGLGIVTVGVDKSWRHIEIGHLDLDARVRLTWSPVATEGFLHWGGRRHFLSMNVETEIITCNQLPEYIDNPYDYEYYYLSTGRYLTLFIYLGWVSWSWQVWEMKPETGEWRELVRDDSELAAQMKKELGRVHCELVPFGWVKYPRFWPFALMVTTLVFSIIWIHVKSRSSCPDRIGLSRIGTLLYG